jgi:hypothetical protein
VRGWSCQQIIISWNHPGGKTSGYKYLSKTSIGVRFDSGGISGYSLHTFSDDAELPIIRMAPQSFHERFHQQKFAVMAFSGGLFSFRFDDGTHPVAFYICDHTGSGGHQRF